MDKGGGMTSADVVARVKRALAASRVGHTGTLDPMATGVLPIVLGEGTKLAPFLAADDKTYEGELELGFETDTWDVEGTVLAKRSWAGIAPEQVRAGVASLVGELAQVPPMHSAIRQGGRRLYDLARAGVTVERPPRRVRIDCFELTTVELPRARFVVSCSKGTYVRSLVHDLGEALGCGATLVALRRTRAGRFTLADAVSLENVAQAVPSRLISLPDALSHLPGVELSADDVVRARQGKPLLAPPGHAAGDILRLLGIAGELVAVVEVQGERLVYLRGFRPM